VLPHAARTFAVCIALLPGEEAAASAVAYLYCRILDTFEDLEADPMARERALAELAERIDPTAATLGPAPNLDERNARDARDRAHLLLVRHVARVDRAFVRLPTVRAVIVDLVRDMAAGMRRASRELASQRGVVRDDEQLLAYCRAVLGNPVVFSARLVGRRLHGSPAISAAQHEDAMLVGEFVQLANVTRDIDKDLVRGVAYDPSLAPWVVRDEGPPVADRDGSRKARIAAARARMLRIALRRAPAYGRLLASLDLPRWSAERAAAILMLLFTERYWRGCARRCGVPSWDGPEDTFVLLARAALAGLSPARSAREVSRVEQACMAPR
jgi:phytoene/squalene synthetase